MCDCYTTECAACDCEMDIHIGDFCTGRENIHPYCPKCTKEMIKVRALSVGKGQKQKDRIFVEVLECGGRLSGVQGGRKGQIVIILCDDMGAYGIHLN